MIGWGKIKNVAKYAGVSERTMRKWLNEGLKYSQLTTGTILIKYSSVDEFLELHIVEHREIDQIVNDTLKGF